MAAQQVVVHEMRERRCGSPVVAGVAMVQDAEVLNPSRFQHSEEIPKRSNRVVAVFQEAIGDDKILALVAEALQSLAIIHYSHVRQSPTPSTGVPLLKRRSPKSIH